jgi:hypothetical protein
VLGILCSPRRSDGDANAVSDALAPLGAEFNATPIKPEQIVEAVRLAPPAT